MAFDLAGTDDYLGTTIANVTAVPLTVACWFNADSATATGALLHIGNNTNSARFSLQAAGAVSGDPVRFQCVGAGTANCDTTTGYSTGTWTHACGVAAAANDRRAYINGGSKQTNTSSQTPSVDRYRLGAVTPSPTSDFDGRIAEAAIWDAALTDEEVAALARGYSPLLIRPGNLVEYWPLLRDSAQNLAGGVTLSASGDGVTVADHPRIIYPRRSLWVPRAGSTGVGLTLNKTLDNVTSSADFTSPHVFTLSKTLDNVTSAAALAVTVQTTLAATLGHVTSSSVLNVLVNLSLAKTLDSVTLSSDTTVVDATVGLSLDQTLGHVTSTSTLTVTVGLSAAITLGDVTLSSTLAALVQLELSRTLDPVTLSSDFSGVQASTLTLNAQLDSVTSAATLEVTVGLSLVATLGSVISSASVNVLVGLTSSVQLGHVTSVSSINVVVGLSSNIQLDPVTLNSTVEIISGRVFSLDVILDSVTSTASYVSDIQLSLTQTVGSVTLAATLQVPSAAGQGGYIQSARKGLREEELERDDLEVLSIVLRKPNLLLE